MLPSQTEYVLPVFLSGHYSVSYFYNNVIKISPVQIPGGVINILKYTRWLQWTVFVEKKNNLISGKSHM